MGIFSKKCPYCGSEDTERTNLDEKVTDIAADFSSRAVAAGVDYLIGAATGGWLKTHCNPPNWAKGVRVKFICNRCHRTWEN